MNFADFNFAKYTNELQEFGICTNCKNIHYKVYKTAEENKRLLC